MKKLITKTIINLTIVVTFFLVAAQTQAYGVPVVLSDEATYLSSINVDFTIDVGKDTYGNSLGSSTQQHDGSDIYSSGIDVVFSSPQAPDSTLVTVHDFHPELGPVGPNSEEWSGSLLLEFDSAITAIGFGTHQLDAMNIVLLNKSGGIISRTPWKSSGFVGIIEANGFWGLLIDTQNNFWSLDGGRTSSGPTSSSQMVGQVPEPATVSLLVLGGLAALRRRKK